MKTSHTDYRIEVMKIKPPEGCGDAQNCFRRLQAVVP